MGEAHGWGTFPKCWAGLSYLLPLLPHPKLLFGVWHHLGASPCRVLFLTMQKPPRFFLVYLEVCLQNIKSHSHSIFWIASCFFISLWYSVSNRWILAEYHVKRIKIKIKLIFILCTWLCPQSGWVPAPLLCIRWLLTFGTPRSLGIITLQVKLCKIFSFVFESILLHGKFFHNLKGPSAYKRCFHLWKMLLPCVMIS